MKNIEKRHAPPFHLASAEGKSGGFVAWAKMGPILGRDPVDEPGAYVWFQFGQTRAQAEERLLRELGVSA
jgi:hypothetical protein